MRFVDTAIQRMRVNRRLTLRFVDYLGLLATAEARERGTAAADEVERLLAADPSGGSEGSLGWNLMHVAVYEEACCSRPDPDLWRRFRHDAPPGVWSGSLGEVADRLAAARRLMLSRAERWRDADLDVRAEDTAQPGMTRRQLLDAATWHEPHHLNVCYDNLRRQLISEPQLGD